MNLKNLFGNISIFFNNLSIRAKFLCSSLFVIGVLTVVGWCSISAIMNCHYACRALLSGAYTTKSLAQSVQAEYYALAERANQILVYAELGDSARSRELQNAFNSNAQALALSLDGVLAALNADPLVDKSIIGDLVVYADAAKNTLNTGYAPLIKALADGQNPGSAGTGQIIRELDRAAVISQKIASDIEQVFQGISDAGDNVYTGYVAYLMNLTRNFRIVLVITVVLSIAFIGLIQRTVQKQARRLVELKNEADMANRTKSSFLANMSHEIRTPMNAVIGMTELLLRQELPREAKGNLSTIKQAGMNLLSIINDILDFSKIEAGKLELVEVEYLFASLVNDIINIIRLRIGEKPLRFTTMIDGKLPLKLLGDEIRVRQILLNLLTNAVKYTNKGNITLSVRGKETEIPPGGETSPPDFTLRFEVKDTGIGIKAEDMDKLFGNFIQFDSKRNRSIEGTGLGLAISRNLCRLMGGSLTAESVYGEGSVFTAEIPQKILDGRPFAPVENAEHKNCLVFEERKTFALSITYTLESLGVPNTLTTSKGELIRELKSGQYQFVFIAWPIAEEIQAVLKKNAGTVKVAAMAEYGKKIPLGCEELYMPTQPVMVANILNGKSTNFGFQDTEFLDIRFTAPEAYILVVDDIASNIDVVSGLLAPYKMTIDKADGGLESIEMIKKRRYDLVLMDHMMPGVDGIEATAAIRAWEETGQILETSTLSFGKDETQRNPHKRIPIIALTANAISGMKEMFLEKGFNDYLSKPIEISKLDEMMSRWIPVEKQIKAGRGIKRETFSGESGIVIPGVDTRKGINMTGGTEAGYRKVMAQFYKDARERLSLLQHMPEPDALPPFVTQAHAIKSAAGTIGAAEVSVEAAALEAAGKDGNIMAVRNGLPAFREHLTELIEGIENVLEERREEKGGDLKTGGKDRDVVLPLLSTLRVALEAKNMKEIDKLFEEIEQLPLDTETREQINAVSDKVLLGEYEGAAEIITILLAAKER